MLTQPRLTLLAGGSLPGAHPVTLRLVIAGSDPLARTGIGSILVPFDDLAILEAFPLDGRLASRVRMLDPDAILCDVTDIRSLDHLQGIDVPVVALVADSNAAPAALAAGARGVLLRGAVPRRIHAALQAVNDGLLVVDEGISGAALLHHRANGEELVEPLTNREGEVIQLLADGLTNKEIANRLGISDHTVKFHVNGILGKLGVESRTEAVVHAARLGIVIL